MTLHRVPLTPARGQFGGVQAMTDPAPPSPPSGAHDHQSGVHDHDDLYDRSQVEVEQSQQIRTELAPLVEELNRIVDRLENLAGYES